MKHALLRRGAGVDPRLVRLPGRWRGQGRELARPSPSPSSRLSAPAAASTWRRAWSPSPSANSCTRPSSRKTGPAPAAPSARRTRRIARRTAGVYLPGGRQQRDHQQPDPPQPAVQGRRTDAGRTDDRHAVRHCHQRRQPGQRPEGIPPANAKKNRKGRITFSTGGQRQRAAIRRGNAARSHGAGSSNRSPTRAAAKARRPWWPARLTRPPKPVSPPCP